MASLSDPIFGSEKLPCPNGGKIKESIGFAIAILYISTIPLGSDFWLRKNSIQTPKR